MDNEARMNQCLERIIDCAKTATNQADPSQQLVGCIGTRELLIARDCLTGRAYAYTCGNGPERGLLGAIPQRLLVDRTAVLGLRDDALILKTPEATHAISFKLSASYADPGIPVHFPNLTFDDPEEPQSPEDHYNPENQE